MIGMVCLLAVAGLCWARPVQAGTCPHDPESGGPAGVTLDECVTTTHFVVYYTTAAGAGSNRILTEAQAQWVADNLEISWDRYVNDPDFGLRVPLGTAGGQLEVWIYDIGYLGVTAGSWNHMEIDAGFVSGCNPATSPTSGDCLQAKATPLHELLHRVQYRYTGFSEEQTTAENFAVEGHTKFMEDEVFTDLDNASGTQYQLRSNGYLGNPNWDVTTASYNACFFWKYFTEQYGATVAEPERGVDAIRHFWLQSEVPGVGGISTVNLTLDALGHPAVTFHQVFRNWIVANYAKDVGTVPNSSYSYVDDNANPYSAVALAMDESVGVGTTTRANQSVVRWGARYYRMRPTATCEVLTFGFHRDSGTPVYHILLIKDDAVVDHWTSTTYDWGKTLINDDYDEIVGIVGGYGGSTQVDVTYGCAGLTLDIILPTTIEPAFVGNISDPQKFLVRLAVTSTQNLEVAGLSAQDFDITVGAQAADIILGAYIQSQYWLLVQAPVQLAAGDYNLTAAYGAATDTETAAVRYLTRVHDDMLVIDRSGSMGYSSGKIEAAQNAARLYVDATADNNMLGLVSFSGNLTEPNEDATLDYVLSIVNSSVRSSLKISITGLIADGMTSIGDGLWVAHQEMAANGNPDHPCALVLLSDGEENEARLWADIQATLVGSPCVIDTIALGNETNEALLQAIAGATGGSYHYVPADNTMLRQGVTQFGDWRNELAGTYEFIQGDVDGRARVFEVNGEASYTDPITHIVAVEDGVSEAVFYANFATPQGGTLRLFNPQGEEVFERTHPGVRVEVGPQYKLYHVMTPTLEVGNWAMVVYAYGRQAINAPAQGVPYQAGASQNSPKQLLGFLGAPLVSRLQGVRMPILAALAGKAPILGAPISATVHMPNGGLRILRLFDDGEHGDGAPDDGLYGNFFTLSRFLNQQDPQPEGSYRVQFETPGIGGALGARFARLSFTVEQDGDNDSDGMPNGWEDANGLDKNVNDAGLDPDLDDLDNLAEYNNGTDPNNSDSDGGGENDGSEADLFAQDPLDPADDEIQAIPWVNASPIISATVLTFGAPVEYDHLRLFRAVGADSGYAAIQNNVPNTGVHTDTFGVVNDTTYYYRMMAVDGDGHRSAVSPTRDATPKLDPFPPTNLGVAINDGAAQTLSRNVALTFFFEEPTPNPDVAEVMIANEPTFSSASWQSYSDTLAWSLDAALPYGEVAHVYVKFRDASENISPDVAGDAILLASAHAIYLPVVLR